MPTIYLDTSAIVEERFLQSTTAQAFFKACKFLGITIVIPEVVIDETKGQFRKRLKEKLAAMRKAQKEVASLVSIEKSDVSLDEEVAKFSGWLDQYLSQENVEVAPYPEVSTKELVEQSYLTAKPFKEDGEGHKDYLIWKTIVTHASSEKAKPANFLITRNTKDFCADIKGESPPLHEQLAEQIADADRRPTVFLSLKKLFDEQLAAKLEGVALAELKHLDRDEIEERATEILENELSSYSAHGFAGVPFGEDVVISSVQGSVVDDIVLRKVGNEIIIEVTGSVDIEVDGFIDKSSYYYREDLSEDVFIVDANWNDHVMQASTTTATPFAVTIIYDPQQKTFSTGSIDLPEERHSEWPYK